MLTGYLYNGIQVTKYTECFSFNPEKYDNIT